MSEFERQHPLAIILLMIRFITQSWRELLPGLLAIGFTGILSYQWILWTLLGLFSAYGIAYWFNFKFTVEEGTLIIKRGVFSKNEVRIPRKKIQTIDESRGILQQLFSLSRVNIETAGSNENAVLYAISHSTAEKLQSELEYQEGTAENSDAAESGDHINGISDEETSNSDETGECIYEMTGGYMAIHSVTSPSILILFAGFFYVLDLANDLGGTSEYQGVIARLYDVGVSYPWISIPLLIGLVALISLFYNVIKLGNFRLVRNGNDLQLNRGLLENKSTKVPLKRIQSIRIKQNILFELAGLARVEIDTAGTQTDTQNQLGVISLMPVVRLKRMTGLLDELGFAPMVESYEYPAQKRAMLRFLLLTSWPFLIAIAALAYFEWLDFDMLWGLLVLPPLAWWRLKTHAATLTDTYLQVRTRLLGIKYTLLPRERVQSVRADYSWFMERNEIEDLVIHNANGSQSSRTHVIGVSADSAMDIVERGLWRNGVGSSPVRRVQPSIVESL